MLDGEQWAYNGLGGFLVSWLGDNCVTVFDEDTSNSMGADPKAWLVEKGCKDMKKAEKSALSGKWSTILLKESQSMFVPTGCLHAVVPLPTKRESLSGTTSADGKKKAPGRKKKDDDNTTEFSSMIFIPVLSKSDAELSPLTVCKFYGRWIQNRGHGGVQKWEKDEKWKDYLKTMEEVASRTGKKSDKALERQDSLGEGSSQERRSGGTTPAAASARTQPDAELPAEEGKVDNKS